MSSVPQTCHQIASFHDQIAERSAALSWLYRQLLDNTVRLMNPPLAYFLTFRRHTEPPFWDDIQ